MNRRTHAVLNGFLAVALTVGPVFAADDSTKTAPPSTDQSGSESNEVAKLKRQLAEQQEQLEKLRVALESQQKLIDNMFQKTTGEDPAKPKSLGQVASLSPVIPPPTASANVIPALPVAAMQGSSGAEGPLSIHLGNTYITPVGFMDFTSVNRTTVGGNGIGSNFGSIPYNNAINGHLSEFRLSAQNSRIGARIDSMFHGANVLAYWESDFLGNNAGSVAVTSNSDTFRLRLYWVDLQKNGWEILAGQSWSMLTPNRKGISPLPANIFYSQDVDVNYQAGLTWTRQPQFRVLYHPSDKVTAGISLENAEQYVGGGGGGGIITPPSNLATTVFTEFNNAGTTLATPNVFPDVIAKVAFDPNSHIHAEVAGLESTFRSYNLATGQHFTKAGGGVSVNLNLELFKGFRVLTNNFYSDGGGRYLLGMVPDLVLKGNGDMGLIHASSTVSGIEWTIKNLLLYSYYGGVYSTRYTVIDTSGAKPTPVGYGFVGSPNSHNRNIQEITFGFNQTFWKDPKYGAINLMGQYSYVSRNPWYVANGQPEDAHQHQIYFNLRYTLPGSAPTLGK